MSSSLIGKAFWLIQTRPGALWATARGYALFHISAIRRRFGLSGFDRILLGDNVRLQNNRSLMAEAPHGRISIGRDSVVYENANLAAYGSGRIEIGESSILGDTRIFSRYKIRIGARVLLSWNVFIQDYDSHPTDAVLRRKQVLDIVNQLRPWQSQEGRAPLEKQLPPDVWNFPGGEISIGDDVWIGANCTILKGAHIGDGCIVAAGSVVTKGEYPPYSVIGGNPAKVIKTKIEVEQ